MVEHGPYAAILHRFETRCPHAEDVDLALSDVAMSEAAADADPWVAADALARRGRQR